MKKYLLIIFPLLFALSFATAKASNDVYQVQFKDYSGAYEEWEFIFQPDSAIQLPASSTILIYSDANPLDEFGCPGASHFQAVLNVSGLGDLYSAIVPCDHLSTTTYAGDTMFSIQLQNSSATISAGATTTLYLAGNNVGETLNFYGGMYYDALQGATAEETGQGFFYRDNFSGDFILHPVLAVPGIIFPYVFSTAEEIGTYADAYFIYPENRVDIFQRDFTSWKFSYENELSVPQDLIFRVFYGTDNTLTASTTNRKFIASSTEEVVYSFAGSVAHVLTIPLPEALATSTTYYAKVCSFQNGIENLCSATISFKTGNVVIKKNTEMVPDTATSTDITSLTGLACNTEFYNPANWACWAGQRVILTWNALKDFATGIFEMGFNFFLQVFPVNVISHLSADLNSVVVATTTPQSLTFTGQGTAYKKAGGGYYSFTFLTSSTLQESETAVGWNWEAVVVYLLWALCGMIIVGSAFALIKHAGHNSTPHA